MAQESDAGNTVALVDAADDVALHPGELTLAGPVDDVDIIQVIIREDSKDELEIQFDVAGPPMNQERLSPQLRLFFMHGEASYMVAGPFRPCGGWGLYDLGERIPTCLAELDHSSPSDSSFAVSLPKHLIPNHFDAPLRAGDSLTQIFAQASKGQTLSSSGGSGPDIEVEHQFQDRAPDAGFGEPFTAQTGDEQRGSIFLRSERPIKVSNGEATTAVFEVLVSNSGDAEATAVFDAVDLPHGWDLLYPASMTVAPNQEVSTSILATVPFTHEHGGRDAFNLISQVIGEPDSFASVELGFQWTAIPHPAGHHPHLFFHAGTLEDGSRTAWMNTLEPGSDPTSNGELVPLDAGSIVVAQSHHYVIDLPLNPGWSMGLEFMPGKPSILDLVLSTSLGIENGVVEAALMTSCDAPSVFETCENTLLAGNVSQVTISSSPSPVTMELTQVNGTRFDWEDGQRLWLRLDVSGPIPANLDPPFVDVALDEMHLHPEGSMLSLALFEYHDLSQQVLADLGGVSVSFQEDVQRVANPGNRLVWNAEFVNGRTEPLDLSLSVVGPNKDWISLPQSTLRLPTESNSTLVLSLSVPASAAPGDYMDAFLVASVDGTTVTGARLGVSVVDSSIQLVEDDELTTNSTPKSTPNLGLLPTLACICLMLHRRLF